jgi:hypothetical protein
VHQCETEQDDLGDDEFETTGVHDVVELLESFDAQEAEAFVKADMANLGQHASVKHELVDVEVDAVLNIKLE